MSEKYVPIRSTTSTEQKALQLAGILSLLTDLGYADAARAATFEVGRTYKSDKIADRAFELLGYTKPRSEIYPYGKEG